MAQATKKPLLSDCLNGLLAYLYFFIDLDTVDQRPINWYSSSLLNQISNSIIFNQFKIVLQVANLFAFHKASCSKVLCVMRLNISITNLHVMFALKMKE